MEIIKYNNLSGWLKFAAIMGWTYAIVVVYLILTW